MHSTSTQTVRRLHDGETPKSWLTGDTQYQKAAVLAAVAWAAVKDADLPDFIHCDQTFRETCIAVCESIMHDNEPDLSPFALKVAELWKQTADYTDRHPNTTTVITTRS